MSAARRLAHGKVKERTKAHKPMASSSTAYQCPGFFATLTGRSIAQLPIASPLKNALTTARTAMIS
jgi:hypothetical protein